MSRRRGRLDAATPQEEGQADTHEAQRRLSVLRQAQLFVISTDEEPSQIHARSFGNTVAELGDLGIRENLGPHAGVLGPLAWKQKRDLRYRHKATLWNPFTRS